MTTRAFNRYRRRFNRAWRAYVHACGGRSHFVHDAKRRIFEQGLRRPPAWHFLGWLEAWGAPGALGIGYEDAETLRHTGGRS